MTVFIYKPGNQLLLISWLENKGGYDLSHTYQHTIERRRISTTLNVTQNGDSRVLVQLIDDDFSNHLRSDWISLAIRGTFGHDDDVQTLTSGAFLNFGERLAKHVKRFSLKNAKKMKKK